MEIHAVYAKTAKGKEEVATRAYRLAFKPRAVLIMVDGASTAADIIAKGAYLGEVAAILQDLESDGFIRSLDAASVVRQTTRDEAAQSTSHISRQPQKILPALKQTASDLLHNALGPDAEALIPKLDASTSVDEFVVNAVACRDVVEHAIGTGAADEFWREIQQLLE